MHKIRNFRERNSTVGEWKGSGRVAAGNGMVCVNQPYEEFGQILPCQISIKLEFFDLFWKNTQISNFMKSHSMVVAFFHEDRVTGRQTWQS
jgi:hypothetical protein